MNRRFITPLLMIAIVALTGLASAETLTAEKVLGKAISAAETGSTLATHDMIQISVHQEETTSDGATTERQMSAIFHGGHLENSRIELGRGISLVLNNGKGWATKQGEVDTRVQTPRMAAGTIRQTLFPLLLPFSLRMDGVRLDETATEGSFDGSPVWILEVDFERNFFAAPSMVAPWKIFISRENNLVVGAEYLPADQFRAAVVEGIRYRVLKRQDVDGINLPAQVLLDGIDLNGAENGHVRVSKIKASTAGPLDLAIFVHPDEMERLDSGDVF